jgi:hypothetical protein
MVGAWWQSTPEVRLSQGDVVTHVPFGAVKHPLTQYSKKNGVSQTSTEWAPDNPEGVADAIARVRKGAAMVLSHECEIDKGKKRVLVAPMTPLTTLRPDERDIVIAQRSHSKLILPDVPLLGDCFLDLRFTTTVDREFLGLDKRIASLSEEALGRLRLQLISFFTRLDATKSLDELSKRSV